MKLIHTGDWHLGKIIYSRSMLDEQKGFIYDFFIPLIERETPDAVIIAGDIFDRSIAPPEAIKLFDGFISYISGKGIPLLAITGNHDGRERITLGAQLLKKSGIYIATDLKDAFEPVSIGNLNFYLIPHIEPAQVREYFQNDEIRGFSDSYKAVTDKIYEDIDDSAVNIAVSHCFLNGCTISESEAPMYIGGSAQISSDLFDRFKLVLLGHLHSPQRAGDNGYYSGSPLKHSFDEQRQKKGVNIFELKDGEFERRFEPHSPIHDMRTISGEFDSLLEQAKLNPSEDYIHIHLQDKKPIFMPMQRLREYYPNALELSTELLPSPGNVTAAPTRRSFGEPSDVFREFSSQICAQEATNEDLELFEKIVREALE